MEVISCVCVVGFDLDEVAAEIMLINCFWNYFYYFLWQNILLAFDEDYAFVAAEVISVFFSFLLAQTTKTTFLENKTSPSSRVILFSTLCTLHRSKTSWNFASQAAQQLKT